MQRWLVFEYHPKGSLYDFLQTRVVSIAVMLKMVVSIVDGLHHLHGEIQTSVVNKPAIAHRDIKTKNILVKTDGKAIFSTYLSLLSSSSSRRTFSDFISNTFRYGSVEHCLSEFSTV